MRKREIARLGYLGLFLLLLVLVLVSFWLSASSGNSITPGWQLAVAVVLLLLGAHVVYFSQELTGMRPWIQAWQTPTTLKAMGTVMVLAGAVLVVLAMV